MRQLHHRADRVSLKAAGIFSIVIALIAIALRPPASQAEVFAQTVYAVTNSNKLLQFNSTSPGNIRTQQAITGLQAGEVIQGIDFRPANGQLYALGSTSRLYTIDPQSGAASVLGTQPFSPTLSGSAFGFDFNPVPDRIRVVGDADQNLRLNPNTGAVAGLDSTLVYSSTDVNTGQDPNVVAAAYTNNISGTTSTTLYVIDSNLDVLARQGGPGGTPSPNTGQLSTVGGLGQNVTDLLGFDITPLGTAYVATTAPGGSSSSFGTIDLATGRITPIGTIGGGEIVRGIAVATRPIAGQTVYALSSTNKLLQFSSTSPGTLTTQQAITGLQSGEALVGIDFRPANGQLYALGSTSRLYTIDTRTGVASVLGTQPLSPTLSGSAFGFDFNPVPDRIRVVSDADQSLRLNPNNGVVAGIDSTLAYSTTDTNAGQNPSVAAAAYTNNISGTTSTTLYVIDSNLDVLARQGGPGGTPSPNAGQLSTIGALGQDVSDLLGFDITPLGTAYVVTTASGGSSSSFGTIDLATGRITPIGAIGGGESVRDIAVTTKRLTYTVYLPIARR